MIFAYNEYNSKSYRSLYFDERKDYKDFIDQLTQHLQQHPNTHGYNNLGVAFYEIGKRSEALDYLSHAIQLDHTNEIAYFNRGELHQKLKHTKEALHDFGKAIELNPHKVTYHRARAYFYKETGEYALALQDFIIALGFEPDFVQTQVEIEWLEKKLNQ